MTIAFVTAATALFQSSIEPGVPLHGLCLVKDSASGVQRWFRSDGSGLEHDLPSLPLSKKETFPNASILAKAVDKIYPSPVYLSTKNRFVSGGVFEIIVKA